MQEQPLDLSFSTLMTVQREPLDLSLSNLKSDKSTVIEKGGLKPVNGVVQPPVDLPPLHSRRTTNQLQFLKKNVLDPIWNHRYAKPFREPVNIITLQLPLYYEVITDPMDLGTIKKRLFNKYYWCAEECIKDFQKVFKNCYVYNNPDQDIVAMAQTLEIFFNKKIERMPKKEVETRLPKRRLAATKNEVAKCGSEPVNFCSCFESPRSLKNAETGEDKQIQDTSEPMEVSSFFKYTSSLMNTKAEEDKRFQEIPDSQIAFRFADSPCSLSSVETKEDKRVQDITELIEVPSFLESPSSLMNTETEEDKPVENILEPMIVPSFSKCPSSCTSVDIEDKQVSEPSTASLLFEELEDYMMEETIEYQQIDDIPESSTMSSFFEELRNCPTDKILEYQRIDKSSSKNVESCSRAEYQQQSQPKQYLSKSLKYCRKILKKLFHKQHVEYAWPFYMPFDIERWQFEQYYDIIEKPMDLWTIKQKLDSFQYKNSQEFFADVQLIFTNCYKYDCAKFGIVSMAQQLQIVFETMAAKVPDEEEDEDEDDDDDDEDDEESDEDSSQEE